MLGMKYTSMDEVRKLKVCVFAFLFNGIGKSSVMQLEKDKVWFKADGIYTRAAIWKCRAVRRE